MAIQPRIPKFISYNDNMRQLAQMAIPHQAAATFFAAGKRGATRIKNPAQANVFAEALNRLIKQGAPYSTLSVIPTHLYDVFGFINRGGFLIHSATVVDNDPEVRVTHIKQPRGVCFISLDVLLRDMRSLTPYRIGNELFDRALPRDF